MKHRIVTAAQMKEIQRPGGPPAAPPTMKDGEGGGGCVVVVVPPPPRRTACGPISDSLAGQQQNILVRNSTDPILNIKFRRN